MPSTALLSAGADPAQLEAAARDLRGVADELDAHASSLSASLRSVVWVGGVATRFNNDWRSAHRPRMAVTSNAVRDAATALDRHAAEQRAASSLTASGPFVVGTWSHDRPPDVDVIDDLDHALSVLGVGRDVLEDGSDLAALLKNDRHAARLIEMLTNDGLVQFLDDVDGAIDGAQIAVDLIRDFIENPELAVDDRIVHAIADTAVRFGIQEGAEHASEFLTTAVMTTLVPGLGSVFGFVAGQAVGLLVDDVMSQVVDGLDATTDFVDRLADLAVDVWGVVKDGVGLVLDVSGAVVGVVGDAADLAGDLASAGVEFVGDVADGAWDLGGDIVGGAADALGALGGLVGS